MINLDSQQFNLCDVQGRLFERALKNGYDGKDFAEKFMNSKAAIGLDRSYDRLQWAGDGYIMEELVDEFNGFKKAAETYPNETMYWMGYVYRYWHYYTGESSKEIYRIADAPTMAMVYAGYHTLAVPMAIDRLKEAYKTRSKDANVK